MLLPVVLVIRFLLLPDMLPVQFDRYETEKECAVAFKELDKTTTVALVGSCEVET